MPSPDILTVAADPKFQALPEADQHAILSQIDPNFGALPEDDKPHVIDTLQRQALTRPDLVSPPAVPKPKVNMRTSPLGKGYEGPGAHDIPGSFEGHPENIGEWPVAGPGQIGVGVKDIAQGKIARGGHEVLSGAGNTMMPFTPFIGTAAPLATARAISGGYIGGRAAEGGADLLNLSPDQKALAGDVGNVIGGSMAAEPAPFIRGTGRLVTARPRVALRTLGERMRNFGVEPPPGPPNPFRDVPEPGPPDVFNVQEPPKIARPSETPSPYRMRPGEAPRDVIRPKGLLLEHNPEEPVTIASPTVRRGPGEIAPEAIRPRAYIAHPAEPIPPRPGLALPPAPAAAPVRGFTPTEQSLRNQIDALTGNRLPQPLKYDVPLRQQLPVSRPTIAAPEGFTPVESSALRAYKYDPANREMSIQDNRGTIHVYGDVSPEDAQTFATAGSKGKAWSATIKQNPHVAKVIGGSRTPSKPPAIQGTPEGEMLRPSARPTIAPPVEKRAGPPVVEAVKTAPKPRIAAPNEDLASVLQRSVEQARAKRGRISARTSNEGQPPAIGRQAESRQVPEPLQPSTPPANGAETTIRVPGEPRSYAARYQVRELEDVQSSHSGTTFNPNPKYSLVNDRDYSNMANRGKVISASAPGTFDPSYHLTDNPDATNGPIVIDSSGHALGGNGRAMILDRVYRYNPEGAANYKALLASKARQFGLDPEDIGKMKRPVLVREIADREFAEPEAKQAAITDFNKKGTAEMTPSERAIVDSRRVSQGTLDEIAAQMDDKGSDATLADVLRSPKATEIVDRLISEGVISPQERAAYAGLHGLTDAGKDRISKLLVGRFFRDPAQLDSTPLSIRGKLERLAAPLAKLDGRGEWDLAPKMQEAIDLLEEVRGHEGSTIDDLLKQQGLFGTSRYSPEAVALAKRLQTSPVSKLLQSVRRYIQDAADAQRPLLMGHTISQKDAFRENLGR